MFNQRLLRRPRSRPAGDPEVRRRGGVDRQHALRAEPVFGRPAEAAERASASTSTARRQEILERAARGLGQADRRRSSRTTFMKKVIDSQRAWVERVVLLRADERARLHARLRALLPRQAQALTPSRRSTARPAASAGAVDRATPTGERPMIRYIRFADRLSAWFGKAFAWLIMLMTLGVSYEVFVRYVVQRADALGLRRLLHHVRHAVHDGAAPTRCRATAMCAATSSTGCGSRATQARGRARPLLPLLLPRHRSR